jgi:hypothetical protein
MGYRSNGRLLRPMARIDRAAGDLNQQKYSRFECRPVSVPLGSNSQNKTKSRSFIEFCAEIGMDFALVLSKWPKRWDGSNTTIFSIVYDGNIKHCSHSIIGKIF